MTTRPSATSSTFTNDACRGPQAPSAVTKRSPASRFLMSVPQRMGTHDGLTRLTARPALLELLEAFRPILLEQPRQRAVGEQAALGLAGRAVVRLVVGVDDALYRRAAHRARHAELAVDGHLGPERRHLVGEAVADLVAHALGPQVQRVDARAVEARDLVVGDR